MVLAPPKPHGNGDVMCFGNIRVGEDMWKLFSDFRYHSRFRALCNLSGGELWSLMMVLERRLQVGPDAALLLGDEVVPLARVHA